MFSQGRLMLNPQVQKDVSTLVSIHMKMQITVSSAAKAKGDTITQIHRLMLTSQKPANNTNSAHL